MSDRLVVVGAGVGGVAAAVAARERGWEGEILITDVDEHSPYDRPPLSKAFLTAGTAEDAMKREGKERLDLAGVILQTGVKARGLDVENRRLLIDDGVDLPFDHLVISTGSSPRQIPGLSTLPGVHHLSSLASAARIRAALGPARSVVVVGGGFIGCEVASSVVAMGRSATIIEAGPRLAGRVLQDAPAAALRRLHVDHGVDVRLGVGVLNGSSEAGGVRLELSDGTSVLADVVVIGVGTIPNVDWLGGSLPVDGGVSCGSNMLVDDQESIYAIGDVAAWWHAGYGRRVRIEHWTTTRLHANVVARTLAGEAAEMRSVPYVWSDQHGIQIQHVGDPDLSNTEVERREFPRGGEMFVYHRGGEVVGATALDARIPFMKLRGGLGDGPRREVAVTSPAVI